jgi:vancomycin resistance protein YoaR
MDATTLDQLPAFAAQLQANLQDQLNTYRFGHEVLASETIDRTAGLIWLSERADEIYQPVVEASLKIDGLDVSSSGSQVGRALDVAATHQAMYDALLDNQGRAVELVVKETEPLLSDVSQAEAFVRLAMAGPVTLTAPDPDLDTGGPPPSYTIPVEELAPLVSVQTVQESDGTLDLKASFDVEPLREQVAMWAADLARDPRDARLDFDPQTGAIAVLTPSQVGRVLDVDATLAAIHQAALSAERQGVLPLRLVEPAVNMHRIEEMGIRELVAEGTTSFKGSSADRVHNIKTGAAAIHGKVIPPDTLFSFNDTVGSVDSENGYKDSLIIWGDRTAVGIGGGICQVSTTVFRAAYYGGLPIEERYNHGYIVGWYGTPGLDATIYTPTVDFKFGNNTGHYLLVESVVDEAKGTLTFRFYGTKPDWSVEVAGPEISNEIAPGAATYQEDPSLSPGQVKQVEWSNKGMDVVWRRTIKDGEGQAIQQDELHSSYTPWSAYYLVGPGTPVPEGAYFVPAGNTQSGG